MITNKQEELSYKWKMEFYDIANKHFRRIFPRSIIRFTLRSEFNAGIAYFRFNEIHLNEHLWRLGGRKEVRKTMGHEIAHQIVCKHYGDVKKYHGPEWEYIMILFGLPVVVPHNMEFPPVRKRNLEIWNCSCRTHKITPRRANKIRSGERIFTCVLCNKDIYESNSE